jgi:hypothetical protein
MTDPGEHAELLSDVPSNVSRMCRIVGHLLIHSDWLSEHGVASQDFGSISRATFPVSARLAEIHGADRRSLSFPREPRMRSVATCRDFAVMLCSMLRSHGAIARVRCGFASYLVPGRWEDHWVCERWIVDESRWAVADAQIDDVLRAELRIEFDPADLPSTAFSYGWRCLAEVSLRPERSRIVRSWRRWRTVVCARQRGPRSSRLEPQRDVGVGHLATGYRFSTTDRGKCA